MQQPCIASPSPYLRRDGGEAAVRVVHCGQRMLQRAGCRWAGRGGMGENATQIEFLQPAARQLVHRRSCLLQRPLHAAQSHAAGRSRAARGCSSTGPCPLRRRRGCSSRHRYWRGWLLCLACPPLVRQLLAALLKPAAAAGQTSSCPSCHHPLCQPLPTPNPARRQQRRRLPPPPGWPRHPQHR